MKQRLIATILIFISWSLTNMLFHSLILMNDYTATAALWRPMEQMNMPLMHIVSLLSALFFVLIYCQVVSNKSLEKGLKLGVIVGLLQGVGMGFGSYSYMPITMKIAVVWCIAAIVNYTIAGLIVGKVVTKDLH